MIHFQLFFSPTDGRMSNDEGTTVSELSTGPFSFSDIFMAYMGGYNRPNKANTTTSSGDSAGILGSGCIVSFFCPHVFTHKSYLSSNRPLLFFPCSCELHYSTQLILSSYRVSVLLHRQKRPKKRKKAQIAEWPKREKKPRKTHLLFQRPRKN